MVTPIVIRRLAPRAFPEHRRTLAELQEDILPLDDPADTSLGHWWVAYEGSLPVAFCGLHPSQRESNTGYLCRAGVVESRRGHRLQRRLIGARERFARRLGYTALVTDTIPGNPASSNNLIASGFRMFTPDIQWATEWSCYWRKTLQ